jgi:hypothetical protein
MRTRKKRRKERAPGRKLSSFVLPSKFKKESGSEVSVICPECEGKIIIPLQVVIDFSPGGKEYHNGGRSDLICPLCQGSINIS